MILLKTLLITNSGVEQNTILQFVSYIMQQSNNIKNKKSTF